MRGAPTLRQASQKWDRRQEGGSAYAENQPATAPRVKIKEGYEKNYRQRVYNIRAITSTKKRKRKIFTFDSPLWNCVGFAEVVGISGREHDRYIYNEEK